MEEERPTDGFTVQRMFSKRLEDSLLKTAEDSLSGCRAVCERRIAFQAVAVCERRIAFQAVEVPRQRRAESPTSFCRVEDSLSGCRGVLRDVGQECPISLW